MRLEQGEQLVRLTAVTPAHLGSAEGEATLDRPTQKEAWSELPFVPDSALKGVLAGRFGDIPEEEGKVNARREQSFGSPDRAPLEGQERPGRPAPLVIGNGELLAFPVPCADGIPAWIFPASTLAWALCLAGEAPQRAGLAGALHRIAESDLAWVWPRLPRFVGTVQPRISREHSVERESPALQELLRRLAGPDLPAAGPLLIVPDDLARALWLQASERRTLVAMESGTRTVLPGAMRRVELIPAGTVFLSLVTCLDEAAGADVIADRFQVGAWESLGLGWFEAVLVEGPAGEPGPRPAAAAQAVGEAQVSPARVMAQAHEAVERLRGQPESFLRKLRSAVRKFGGRAQFGGLESALAFELAKAKPEQARPSEEARAHRWLLEALFTPEPAPPPERGPSEPLRDWLATDPFAPRTLDAQRDLLLTRWHWLKRFLEFGPEEEAIAEAEETA